MKKWVGTDSLTMDTHEVDIRKKSKITSFFFLLFFISPSPITSVMPRTLHPPYFLFLFFGYIFCGIYLWDYLTHKKNTKPLVLTLSFVILGSLNLFIHSSNATFNIIAPVSAYIGYCYTQKERINVKLFDYLLISMYAYYYYVYYRTLPDLFFRPDFDEGSVFDIASSNAIAIGLNIILYGYMIYNRLLNESSQKKILYFSIINFLLIVIQQSRAGLFVALMLIMMSLYEYNKKKFRLYLSFLIPIIILTVVTYLSLLINYFEIIGQINENDTLDEDVRNTAQTAFFNDMDFYSFIFGYPQRLYGVGYVTYTYNVFLDMWNRYGVIQLVFFFSILVSRVYNWRKFHFPVYYFFPFFFYCSVESIFFPSFWDTIIYIPLFTLVFNNLSRPQVDPSVSKTF